MAEKQGLTLVDEDNKRCAAFSSSGRWRHLAYKCNKYISHQEDGNHDVVEYRYYYWDSFINKWTDAFGSSCSIQREISL